MMAYTPWPDGWNVRFGARGHGLNSTGSRLDTYSGEAVRTLAQDGHNKLANQFCNYTSFKYPKSVFDIPTRERVSSRNMSSSNQ